MSKQLLIYSKVTPLVTERHKSWAIKAVEDYAFASDITIIPILASEFQRISLEYPIVFIAGEDETPLPVAVVSIDSGTNAYLNSDNSWDAAYIPAFIRRYPFIFSRSEDGEKYILCIDEEYAGIQHDGNGDNGDQALFTDSDEPSEYTQAVLDFLKVYQIEHEKTIAICKQMRDRNLFERKQLSTNVVNSEGQSEEKVRLSGFFTIDRSRVSTLKEAFLIEMFRNDALEMIYNHLASLEHFTTKRFASLQPS